MRSIVEKIKIAEILSVTALVAIFTFLEVNFRLFENIATVMMQNFPASRGVMTALAIGCWIGLFVYSLRRRSELSKQTKTQKQLEEDMELIQISDSIAGLPNRNGFGFVLNEYLLDLEKEPFSLLPSVSAITEPSPASIVRNMPAKRKLRFPKNWPN